MKCFYCGIDSKIIWRVGSRSLCVKCKDRSEERFVCFEDVPQDEFVAGLNGLLESEQDDERLHTRTSFFGCCGFAMPS